MEAIARRSPSSENNTAQLQAQIRSISGLSGDEKISDLSQDEMDRLVSAIQRTEGWIPGTVSHHK